MQESEDEISLRVATEAEYEEAMSDKICLDLHSIYCDRNKKMPNRLQILVDSIQDLREAPPSPISRKVASASGHIETLSEIDAMILLEDFLGYVPQDSLRGDGQTGILRRHNQSWGKDTVPMPATEQNATLAKALEAVGPPRRPQPDIVYGFSDNMLAEAEKLEALALPPSTRVTNKEPRWPFLIVEWKGNGGLMLHGRLQAMRGGAAAVASLWHLFKETGTTAPREDETAVFCACIGPETLQIYVSWRRQDSKAGLSWEMDRIHQALLSSEDDVYQARSILLNILTWARTDRLDRIKAALKPSA